MFYKWIKPLDPEQLSSFIFKTIMMWTCEEYPPDHVVWEEDDFSTLQAVSYLFKEMHKSLQKGSLPYYFIPSINVIANITKDIKTMVTDKIISILSNIKHYIPGYVNNIVKVLDFNYYYGNVMMTLLKNMPYKNREAYKEIEEIAIKLLKGEVQEDENCQFGTFFRLHVVALNGRLGLPSIMSFK